MTLAALILAASTLVTLAHEIGHAFGIRDIYASIGVPGDEGYSELEGFVCKDRCPNDWNGGCDGNGESGSRFYPPGTFQYGIVRSLLMDGEKEDVNRGIDITIGSIWGYGPDDTLGNQDTGYFTNARQTDDPQHQ